MVKRRRPRLSGGTLGRHYFREWREQRGLSLRQLADRLESSPGGEPLISYASLQRIERGDQAYTEDVLVAVAGALGIEPWMLIEANPTKEGEVVDLLRRLNEQQREQFLTMLRAVAGR